MKIPEKIKGRNKIRDAAILRFFLRDSMTLKEIGSRFNLTASRVQQIVYNNRELIIYDKMYEKAVRVNALKRLHEKHPDVISKKSTLDIIQQIREEIEGTKVTHEGIPSAQVNVYPNKIYIFKDLKNDSNRTDTTRHLPTVESAGSP